MSGVSSVLPRSRDLVTQLLESLSAVQTPSIDQADNANANPLNNVSDTTRKQLLALQVLFPNEFVPALDLLDRRLVTRFCICDEEELALLKTTAEGEGHDIHMRNTNPTPAVQREQNTQIQYPNTTPTHPPTEPPSDEPEYPNNETNETNILPTNTIYYVRSAQHRSSRYSTSYDTLVSYQVRLLAWNCSCPAFAFAAFPPSSSPSLPPAPLPAPPAPPPLPPTHSTDISDTHSNLCDDDDDNDSAQNPRSDPSDTSTSTSTSTSTATLHQSTSPSNKEWVFGGITLGSSMPPVCKHLLACVLAERCRGLFGEFLQERRVGVEEAAGWAAGWGD